MTGMKNLTKEQKDLILDFYFRCGSEASIDEARDLIASDQAAAELYSKLELSLRQLDSVKYEPCPDNLAELTVARLKLAAAEKNVSAAMVGQTDINQLLAAEHKKTVSHRPNHKPNFSLWRFAEIGVAAAMLLIVVNAMFPIFSNMRQMQYKGVCAANLGNIAKGLSTYQNSFEGKMPYVSMSDDAPWWKVGCQDQENQSNTRHYWLLVKGDYVEASNFTCPGRKDASAVRLSRDEIQNLCDFPSRDNVSYSFKLVSEDTASRRAEQVLSVIMADRNPIFESISTKYDQDLFGKIALNERLLKMMSVNHSSLGQNVLISGGSAAFKDSRVILNDDIYTLRDQRFYSGNERPASDDDSFLVP